MRKLTIALPVVAAAVALTGACASPAGTVTHESAGGQAQTVVATKPPAAKPATAVAAKPKPVKTPYCHTGDTSAVITAQPDRVSGSTRMAMINLVNKSKHACVVDGWTSISLVNAADEVVPVHTTNVNQPGRPVRIVLKPGGGAFAGIKWTVCDKGDSTCGAGNTLRFNLDASTDGAVAHLEGFPNPEASDITMKSLQIGSLQPSNQGVVAW